MRTETDAIVRLPTKRVAVVGAGGVAHGSTRSTVDVVIPMRDGASTIVAALASVCAQTCPPGRIFVIDDGSQDGGGELVRARFPLATVIKTPAHGVSHARNVGIAHSRAEFIAFLDCDDLWAENKLEQQLVVARRDPQVAVITCGSISFDMQHRPVAGTNCRPRLRGEVFERTLRQGYLRGGLSSNMLVRRRALLAVGAFDETIAVGEDVDLWLRLARRYTFDYCCATLAYIVENPQSTTRRPGGPQWRRESLLQVLSGLEKWVGDRTSSRWILAFAARLILAHAVAERLTAAGMWSLREAIEVRAPKLGRRLARTRAHLLAAVVIAGLLYFPSIWDTWRLRRRRLLSCRKQGIPSETADFPHGSL